MKEEMSMTEPWAVAAARKIIFPDGEPQEGYTEADINEVAKLILTEYLNRREICGNCVESPCICGTKAWQAGGSHYHSEYEQMKAQKNAILAKLPDSIGPSKESSMRLYLETLGWTIDNFEEMDQWITNRENRTGSEAP